MKSFTFPLFLCLAPSLLLSTSWGFEFGSKQSILPIRHSRSTTVLLAYRDDDSSKRRDFLNAIKRVFIGTGGAAVLNQDSVRAAFADDAPASGKVVEITIANLNGDPGKMGKIQIALRPDWAPRGVARFEVNFCCAFESCDCSY